MADEELVDPLTVKREECAATAKCTEFKKRLDKCTNRQPKTGESCYEELIDFVNCVDHCAAKGLFSKLK